MDDGEATTRDEPDFAAGAPDGAAPLEPPPKPAPLPPPPLVSPVSAVTGVQAIVSVGHGRRRRDCRRRDRCALADGRVDIERQERRRGSTRERPLRSRRCQVEPRRFRGCAGHRESDLSDTQAALAERTVKPKQRKPRPRRHATNTNSAPTSTRLPAPTSSPPRSYRAWGWRTKTHSAWLAA